MLNKTAANRMPGVDALRFIGAMLVPALHVGLFDEWPRLAMEITRGSLRWIVPFFFIAMGFFIGRNAAPEKAAFASMRRLFSILLLISVLMIPAIALTSGAKSVIYILLSTDTVVRGVWFHLWFLHAAIVALFVACCKPDWIASKAASAIALALVALACCVDSAYAFQRVSFEMMTMSRSIAGASMVVLGVYLSRFSTERLAALWRPLLFAAIVIGTAHSAAIFIHHGKAHELQLNLGCILLAFALFFLSLTEKPGPSLLKLADYGRRFALGIYLIHPIIIVVLNKIGVTRSDALWLGAATISLLALRMAEIYLPSFKAAIDGRL